VAVYHSREIASGSELGVDVNPIPNDWLPLVQCFDVIGPTSSARAPVFEDLVAPDGRDFSTDGDLHVRLFQVSRIGNVHALDCYAIYDVAILSQHDIENM
jgi:hypothetical protein